MTALSASETAAVLYTTNVLREVPNETLEEIGFSADVFIGDLWTADRHIFVSSIISLSPDSGNVTALFRRILDAAYNLTIMSPSSPEMLRLLLRNQFELSFAYDPCLRSNIELWTLSLQTYHAADTPLLDTAKKPRMLTSDYLSRKLTNLRRNPGSDI